MYYDIVTFSDNLKSDDNYQNHTTSKMYQSLIQVRADISTLLCIHNKSAKWHCGRHTLICKKILIKKT